MGLMTRSEQLKHSQRAAARVCCAQPAQHQTGSRRESIGSTGSKVANDATHVLPVSGTDPQ